MSSGDNPLSHVLPHELVTRQTGIGEVTVLSDQIVMMITAGVFLCLFFPRLLKKRRGSGEVSSLVPAGFANAVEAICQYFRKEVAEPQLGVYTDRFIKYIWSVFFFIVTINLLGLLPLGTLSPVFLGTHIGGTATANIWVTGTLAVLTLILMVYNGLKIGGKAYLAHFSPGPVYLAPLMIVLELIGLVSKTGALALRLFANMLAGHVLLAVLLSMIFSAGAALGLAGGLGVSAVIVASSVAVYLLEIFVALLQAFIFTYLTTLFIAMSVNVHDHGEAH